MPRNIANPNRTSVSPRLPAEMSPSPSAHPVDIARRRRPALDDASPLTRARRTPRCFNLTRSRAADRLTTDDDLRHRPPTGPLGKQTADVRDAVDRALLEREVESLQKPARPSRGSENIEQED